MGYIRTGLSYIPREWVEFTYFYKSKPEKAMISSQSKGFGTVWLKETLVCFYLKRKACHGMIMETNFTNI